MIWKLCMFRCFFPFPVIARQTRPVWPHLLPGNETRYSHLFLDRIFTFMNQHCSLRLKSRKPEVQLHFKSELKGNSPRACHSLTLSLQLWSVAQSWRTLCDPMDCRPPSASLRGIFQARILEWDAICFFRYDDYFKFIFYFFLNLSSRDLTLLSFLYIFCHNYPKYNIEI